MPAGGRTTGNGKVMRSVARTQVGPTSSARMTTSRSLPPGVRPRVIALWRDIPRDLTIAWLAITPLYLIGPRGLPEPMIALAVGTTVGLASAVLKAGIAKERAVAMPAIQLATNRRPLPPSPSERPWTPAQPDAAAFEASRQAGQGDGVEAPPMEAHPPDRSVPRLLDFDQYSCADPSETQCPNCGSFDTARIGATGVNAICRMCCKEWTLDGSASAPDVVVRSWWSQPKSTLE